MTSESANRRVIKGWVEGGLVDVRSDRSSLKELRRLIISSPVEMTQLDPSGHEHGHVH